MGPQNQNYTEKNSRFWVMGQKEDSKKGPKSWISPEKKNLGTSEWYQSIGLKILHNICLPQIFSLVCSSQAQKNTRACGPQGLQGAKSVKLFFLLEPAALGGLQGAKSVKWNFVEMWLRCILKVPGNKWHDKNVSQWSFHGFIHGLRPLPSFKSPFL